ncbi:MAG TPA: tRNA (N6-isopentenyl adenosine(37)-C2)-methylthiotransferase MiaB [Thermoanaerobaculia bacterium]|nr:tRNA (N6-isopentenyl adenosine(37)-C2)-methylthiotransferase MiaB [Thermoanaerobaculia bacterium]
MEETFFIETWGCQMNDLDTQRLAGQLKLRGYRRVQSEQEAGLILLNTCSIREKSEQKMFSHLGRLRDAKARGAKIGVCGCVAQQEGEAILRRAPYVDFVMGPGQVGFLDEILAGGSGHVAVDFPGQRKYDYLAIDRPSAVRAQVTVIEGCNKNCTFCIVPTTRGREISRPLTEILNEVRHARSTGRVEIELLGQTVNAYRCPVSGADFADLLREVASIAGVKRLRFITSHPAEVNERMIAALRDHPNICRYLHLPVQSGSSAVLRRMKRLYTRERYLEVIARIREAVPEMRFSTDIIVGFPGETDADFEQTLSMLEEMRYVFLYAFKYSPRPGTPAVRLPDPVADDIATERVNRVFALQEKIEREILASFRGKIVPILVEGPSRNDTSMMSGKTDDNWTVNFRVKEPVAVGEMISVEIQEASHHSLRGEAAA